MAVMSLATAARLFSILALAAGAGAVVITIARFIPAARDVVAGVAGAAHWLAFAVAATAMAGSLYFSEIQNLVPCRLCWFQRIAMFPLAVITLVGALRRDRTVAWYAVPIAAVGLAISVYHYLIEWYPNLETGSCDPAAPCSVPYFRGFDFVSLALMAACGFAAVIALLTLPGVLAPADDEDADEVDVEGDQEPDTASPTSEPAVTPA